MKSFYQFYKQMKEQSIPQIQTLGTTGAKPIAPTTAQQTKMPPTTFVTKVGQQTGDARKAAKAAEQTARAAEIAAKNAEAKKAQAITNPELKSAADQSAKTAELLAKNVEMKNKEAHDAEQRANTEAQKRLGPAFNLLNQQLKGGTNAQNAGNAQSAQSALQTIKSTLDSMQQHSQTAQKV